MSEIVARVTRVTPYDGRGRQLRPLRWLRCALQAGRTRWLAAHWLLQHHRWRAHGASPPAWWSDDQ